MANYPARRDSNEVADARRAQLILKHGHTPEMLPWKKNGAALRMLGIREEIHPNDCAIFLYRTRAEFNDWRKNNIRYNGHEVRGPYDTDAGILGVVDFRRALTLAGGLTTDPGLPDDFYPPRPPSTPELDLPS
jgi:hypothetical protein